MITVMIMTMLPPVGGVAGLKGEWQIGAMQLSGPLETDLSIILVAVHTLIK